MIHNKLQHCFFGLVVFAIGIVGGLSVSMSPIIKVFFLVLAVAGGFWACVIGHAGMYFFWLLAIPFYVVGYFIFPPVRLKNGKAYDAEYEVIAYSVLSDRIILVREFPIQDTIEGVSIFRPKRMLERTKRRLTRSVSLQITLDESKVQQFFGGRLPDMENLERDRVDSIHRRVGKLWKKHRQSEMREDVVHLAAWYSLAADRCYGHEDRTWLDHVLL